MQLETKHQMLYDHFLRYRFGLVVKRRGERAIVEIRIRITVRFITRTLSPTSHSIRRSTHHHLFGHLPYPRGKAGAGLQNKAYLSWHRCIYEVFGNQVCSSMGRRGVAGDISVDVLVGLGEGSYHLAAECRETRF